MTLFDFSDQRTTRVWAPIDDVVMGGLSSSRIESSGDGTAIFAGEVSLDNNGGFASIRTRPEPVDLSAFDGLELRLRGDGKRYKLNLKLDTRWDGVQYRVVFDTEPGEWQTIRVPFDEFVPTYRGRVLSDVGPFDPARVTTFGLMISDKQAGPFRLEVARIDAFKG